MRKTLALILLVFALILGTTAAMAQAPVVNPGWEVFVIREGATEAPFIVDNDDFMIDSIEVGTTESGQKVGLATNLINGALISQISTLHIDRLDDVNSSGSLYGPYFNIWITDGAGNFAVIANEPSNAEWGGEPWDVADWNELSTKVCKVYETPGWNDYTSWVHVHAGVAGPLTFNDVANLAIAPPPPAYIQDVANGVGSGAPDVLGTDIAYGYTWVFGDTASNYVSGGDGFIVNGYSATATFAVQNITQGTSYATIEAALAAANPADVITIDDGTYNPPGTLNVNMALTISGASEAGVIINIPAAGGYGFAVGASNVTLQNFTLATNVVNQNYPIHASGTSNPLNGFDNLTIENVTISGTHRRTGFDIHGFNNLVLSHLTSSGATGGNGLQITGCVGVTIDNITAINNAWGSLAIYCSDTQYLGRPSSNVTFDGATLNLDGAFFSQDEFGFINYNIVITGWAYNVQNSHFREALGYSDSEGYTFFAPDQATAYAIATGFTGYEMYSAMFNKVAAEWEVIPGLTIQAAVEHAADLDTIDVVAGTYIESGQIVINKNLTINGDDAVTTILNKVEDSGNTGSGNDRGWFLVEAGSTLNISGITLDGVGRQIAIGILTFGTLNISDCDLANIGWTQASYYGRGICLYGETTNTLTRVNFSNIMRIGVFAYYANTVATVTDCSYTGKGDGDWIDYGFEAGGGAAVNATGTTITACTGVALVDDSTSAGFLYSTYFDPGTSGIVTNCVLTGNSVGVHVGYIETDTSDVTITGCDVSGNTDFGIVSVGEEITALGNWWGHATGPFDDSDDTATGGLYNPLGLGVPVTDNVNYNPWTGMAGGSIEPVTTGPLNCTQTITLTFSFTADAYTPDMFLYNAVVNATPGLDFGAVTDLLPFGTVNNNFYDMSTGANQMTITGSTVGSPTSPVTADGTTGLFSIVFSATGDVTGGVVFESLTLRDPDNNTIPVNLSGATITYDCTAPLAVTGITADPHHNKVGVNWVHDGEDVDHYEVFSGVWHDGAHASAYPEYDDIVGNAIPARPANYTAMLADVAEEWEALGNVAAVTIDETWANADDRGVYYYEVYAVDAAGNASPRAAANDRATNYWLGDFNANGEVAVYDISVLGGAFGTSEAGGGAYLAMADVGPTDNWSRVGIPTTDNYVNFEDLMVVSMNFGVVSPTNKTQGNISAKATLAWSDLGNNQYALHLVDGSGIKGLHVQAAVAEGSIHNVTAGSLLDEQSEMTFLRNIGSALDVSVAVTGVENGFTGSGALFIVSSSAPINMSDLNIEVRGYDNSSLEMTMEATSGVLTPRVFALEANYPNPFNPMTKISFSLPEAQDVRLNIYSVDGRKVATLVNEARSAGLHEVLWMGQDDAGQTVASGLYFYRIDAGPYSQVRKMTLMK